MGVVSTVLLSAGVLRHYWDIYIHRTVRGISFIFVGIDAAGDVFSLVSVCEFRVMYGTYVLVANTIQFSSLRWTFLEWSSTRRNLSSGAVSLPAADTSILFHGQDKN